MKIMNRKIVTPVLGIGIALLSNCSYTVNQPSPIAPTGLIINEVLSSNGTGIVDEFGKRSDWIELFNNGDTPVNLGEYALSDKSGNRHKWVMGDSILNPGEYIIIQASGNDIPSPRPALTPIEFPIDGAGSWADSDLGGYSFANPWQFKEIYDPATQSVSATLFLADNGAVLDWMGETAVTLQNNLIDQMNISHCNQIELFGYIEKGKQLDIRFPQKSWQTQQKYEQYFTGVTIPVIGTGEPNGHYTAQLNGSDLDSILKLSDIGNIDFMYNQFDDSIHFTINKVLFSEVPSAMHTSFSLDDNGGSLFLTNKKGVTVDSVDIPALDPDCSWGRLAVRSDLFGFCTKPTPGSNNNPEGQLATFGSAVKSTIASGFYKQSVTVELDAENPGDTIRYTFDGSIPTEQSMLYTGPFTVNESKSIRFASFKNGVVSNKISNRTILIDTPPGIPVISIIVDSTALFDPIVGIHEKGVHSSEYEPYFGANYWDESKEIPASIEYFEGNGNRAFELTMGLSIQGNYSKMANKKGFAMVSRKKYGNDGIHYPLFPNHPNLIDFKSIIVRPEAEHQSLFLFDAYRTTLTEGMNIEYQKSRPAVVYINGEYRGLYNLQEKLNENYFETNFGIDADQISLIKEGGVIQAGSATEYIQLLEYVRNCDITTAQSYNYINNQMDILNYSDYFSTLIYLTNTDWPANNIKWWRDRSSGGRWRWALYDTDQSKQADFNMIEFIFDKSLKPGEFPNGSTFSTLFSSLLKNDQFESDFINRTACFLNMQFSPERARTVLDSMVAETESLWRRDFKRWGIPERNRTEKLDELHDFIENRPAYLRQHLIDYFDLGASVRITLGTGKGSVLVNGIATGSSINGEWFTGSPVTLSLSDSTGFVRWSDGVLTATRLVTPVSGLNLRAEFR